MKETKKQYLSPTHRPYHADEDDVDLPNDNADLTSIDDDERARESVNPGNIHDYTGVNGAPMRGESSIADASGDTDSTEEWFEPAESGNVPTSFSGDGGALEDDSRGLDE